MYTSVHFSSSFESPFDVKSSIKVQGHCLYFLLLLQLKLTVLKCHLDDLTNNFRSV